jgi:transaldolase
MIAITFSNIESTPAMRLYLDTADKTAWAEWMPSGVFCGITTNPLLAVRAGLTYDQIKWQEMVQIAADAGAREFHAQVNGSETDALQFAENLYAYGASSNIDCVVKIPLNTWGISLTPKIQALGGKTLMTACYDAKQMITANALGADYIAPYFGRMAEAGLDAMAHMRAIHAMSCNGPCRPLIASLRSAQQMMEIAEIGHDCFTIAPTIAQDLFHNELTEAAAEEFERAAKGERT